MSVSANVYVELDRKCLRQNKSKIEPQRDKDTLMMTNESVEDGLKLWKVRREVCVWGGLSELLCVSQRERELFHEAPTS